MKTKTILTLAYILTAMSLSAQHNLFEFVIKGKVTGKQSGDFIFLGAGSRAGDEIYVSFNEGTFEYKGTSSSIHTSFFAIDNLDDLQPFVIEPGEIILEITPDSFNQKFNVLSGEHNLELQKARRTYSEFADPLLVREDIR